jgi:uncharacterized protein (DUF1501 family)
MPASRSTPLSRRELLRIGGSGVMGLSLARLLAAGESGATAGSPSSALAAKADACIILMLNGGPSHLDMWDLKPEAPDNIRGEFKPIASSLPGVPLSEHLPKLAQLMHRCALVRSMNHSVNNAHALAVYTAMTGDDRGDANRIVGNGISDQPAPGAVLARVRPGHSEAVPHVALPYMTKEGAGGPPQPGFFGGWLGRQYDPLWVLKDPSAADFSVPEFALASDVSVERLAKRGQLLASLGSGLYSQHPTPALSTLNRYQQRALDVLTGESVRDAFRLEKEADATRESYGRNIYGQSVLLARRLVEAGTRVVTVSWAPDANATWDTHGGNFKKLKGTLLPQFDAACGSLLVDLAQRGMLERTVVAVIGDFGRTPKINGNDGGRDHWNYCYTVMLAGGGVRPGFVFGASDKTGAFPADRPVTPGDFVATLYRLLGVDPAGELYDAQDRPHRIIPKGDAISELIV